MPAGYKKDFLNHGVFIPKFVGEDTGLTDITFGGFICDKYICSKPSASDEIGSAWYDVAASANPGSVPAVSKLASLFWDYISMPQAMIACANKGKGWHLMTDFEWASLGFLTRKQKTPPHGNNMVGLIPSNYEYSDEIALSGIAYLTNKALTGSGPAWWAHNHHASGVYDLSGVCNQWGCMFITTAGYPCVSANLDLSYFGSPFGRGTISGTNTLTCDGAGANWMKGWSVWLKYDAEETPFTAGSSLVGLTSGATGIVLQVIDNGTSGLLEIRKTNAIAFQDNEIIIVPTAGLTKTVSGTANNGGLIEITTSATHTLTTGNKVTIVGVLGTTEANNTDTNTAWVTTVVSTTKFTLDGSTYANAWISGGTSYRVSTGVAAVNGSEIGEFSIIYLGYDGIVSSFALGDTVTGATSGHTGIVVSDNNSGTYGTLGLLSATGVFQNDENLQVGGSTVAVANQVAQRCKCYVAELDLAGAGTSYEITASTPTTLTLSGSPTNGVATFWLFKTISRDITAGITSGRRILTLRDSDEDLKAFAIPATADTVGSEEYGCDGVYFSKTALRGLMKGGMPANATSNGIFRFVGNTSLSASTNTVGFRACKAL